MAQTMVEILVHVIFSTKNRENLIQGIKNQGTNFGSSSDWLEKKLKEEIQIHGSSRLIEHLRFVEISQKNFSTIQVKRSCMLNIRMYFYL